MRLKISRINLIFIFILLFATAIVSRLVYLQIVKGDVYLALAKGQQEIFESTPSLRGEIFLHDSSKLVLAATNKDCFSLYVSPKTIKDKEKAIKVLSANLGLEENQLRNQIDNANKPFILIKKGIDPKVADNIKAFNLPGVYLRQGKKRFYPLGKLAADVIGFVNSDNQGQYGIEGYWNQVLSGSKKLIKKRRGLLGYILPSNEQNKGDDIILTIDVNIQAQAEKILEEASKNLNIQGGQIIVMDPKTGKILALADWPTFDPNHYQEYIHGKESYFQDGAIQQLFEPGSIFKAITMAAALNEGKVTPETTYLDKGYVKIKGRTIYNYRKEVFGKTSMTKVLEDSINSGAVFAESQLSHSVFLNYLKRFGIFKKTGIRLAGEIFSENKEFKKGYEINFATASFGQGIDMTPLQIIRAYTPITDNGKLLTPYVVEAVKRGNSIKPMKPGLPKQTIIKPSTAKELTKMLINVVEKGYGRGARVPGYYIAGKTGTSQMPYASLGIQKAGYSKGTWQSFIGYGPAFDPKFLILVKLDNPSTKEASYSAAKLFLKIERYVINYLNIPPDYQ